MLRIEKEGGKRMTERIFVEAELELFQAKSEKISQQQLMINSWFTFAA